MRSLERRKETVARFGGDQQGGEGGRKGDRRLQGLDYNHGLQPRMGEVVPMGMKEWVL